MLTTTTWLLPVLVTRVDYYYWVTTRVGYSCWLLVLVVVEVLVIVLVVVVIVVVVIVVIVIVVLLLLLFCY